MKKEYLFIMVLGFFILAYVLDALTIPLDLSLKTPYHFFTPENVSLYPFTMTSILLKTAGVVIAPILILASLEIKRFAKAGIMLVLSGLVQLYALQDVASQSFAIPLEWSLGLTLGGMVMLLPAIFFFIAGLFEAPPTAPEGI